MRNYVTCEEITKREENCYGSGCWTDCGRPGACRLVLFECNVGENMANSEFHYDLEQNFATLSRREARTGTVYTKELNLVSFNDADPVYDLRNWSENTAGERRMGKGITLTLDELRELRDFLNDFEDLDEEEEQ